MSKDASSSSSSSSSRSNLESNENDADTLFLPFPPPRTPLNSITDPSQCQIHPTTLNKSETTRSLRGKSHSEPNSAQTTPLRRISNVFTCPGARYSMNTGPKGPNKTSKGTPVINSEPSVQVPHFELAEDPSFWKDHNVQEKLFRVAGLPMVDNCMSGYNSCMFAYGQTGSGKTYTMMGDIGEMSGKLCEQCGITPRIFEYLFTRIREEEDKRKNERLKYSCKCSFLEIYNEQITDLLEPSSTNLLVKLNAEPSSLSYVFSNPPKMPVHPCWVLQK